MPTSRTRKKQQQTRARRTQSTQKDAEKRRHAMRSYRTRRVVGWSLVVVAVIVGVTHFLEHLGVFAFASPGVEDLVAGYPLAALLGVAGSIILTHGER